MNEFPVSLTESALKAAAAKMALYDDPIALRLGVKGGGCSGYSYVLAWEYTPARPTDLVDVRTVMEIVSIEVRCDPKSALVLRGTVLDYVDNGLNGRGFTFTNPQERSRCGCGTSFNV